MVKFEATHDPVTNGVRYKGPYWKNIRFLDYIVELPFHTLKKNNLLSIVPNGDIFVNLLFAENLSNKKLLPIHFQAPCSIADSIATISVKFKYLAEPEDFRVIEDSKRRSHHYVVSTLDPHGIFLKGEHIGYIRKNNENR